MGRATTKDELLTAAAAEFDRLWTAVAAVSTADREIAGACDDWSVKDLLAHLHAWHEMALRWERAGSEGLQPAIPAEGYSFAETPALNAAIHARTEDDEWGDVVDRLRSTHESMLSRIDGYSDDDLFTKRRYAWTKSTSVGAYMVSATASHYAWASKLIRAWTRSRAAG